MFVCRLLNKLQVKYGNCGGNESFWKLSISQKYLMFTENIWGLFMTVYDWGHKKIFYKHMFTEKFRISQFKKNILHYILQRKNEYLCRENMSEFLYVILCRRSNTWVCLLYQKRQNFLQKELFMKISVWNSSWLILLLFGVLHYFCTYIRIILRIFTENNWVRYSFFLCRI